MRLFAIVGYIACAVACHSGQEPSPSTAFRVAALLKTSTNPYFQLMWEGIKQEADLRGMSIDLFWPSSESDFAYQYDFLRRRAMRYDAILLAPSDVENIASYLPPLKRAGKKIVVLDAEIQIPDRQDSDNYYDAFLGTNNELGGMMVAKYVAPKLRSGATVIIVGGFPQHMNVSGRVRAFRDALLTRDPTIKTAEFTADYDRATAQQLTENHRKDFASADLIFCANDHMALGVLDAFRSQRVTSHPLVTGYDSIREAQEQIMRGELFISVVQFPARMGREGVRAIEALRRNSLVEKNILIDPELSVRRVSVDSLSLEHLYEHPR